VDAKSSQTRSGRYGLALLTTASLAALFLLCFVNPHLPLDQDLGSKAAKIENLARSPWFASPLSGPQYYREAYFSFYYQVEALLRRLIPLSALAVSGYSAALCGVIYLIAISIYLRSLAGLNAWWTLFLFLNTPALVINFLYGNEASLSMALVAVAAALLVIRRGIWADCTAGCALGLSFFCRPDIVLMAPFILVSLCTRAGEERTIFKFEWQRILVTGGAAIVVAGGYWLLVVRSIPAETAFPWIIDWRIFASYFVFGFGPVVVLLAVWGAWLRARSAGLIALLLPLSTLFPLIYYFRDLGSPKYILGLAFGTLLCAAWAIVRAARVWKIAALCAAAFFWVFSVTPFGIFGPSRGGYWVIPAGHGPIAFGAYASFYNVIRSGFFQYRYGELLKAWDQVVAAGPRPLRIVGSSDDHMLDLLLETTRRGTARPPVSVDRLGEHIFEPGRQVMFFNGYSRLSYLTAPGAEELVRKWLAAGLVKPLSAGESTEGLPLAVEVGWDVSGGSRRLGQRILFAEQYGRDGGLTPLPFSTADYRTFCFVPVAAHPGTILFADGEFAATNNCPGAQRTWGNWWPAIYYQRHGQQARGALVAR
jgi:hypothetical protein